MFAQLLASKRVNTGSSFDERLLFQRAFDEFDAVHIQILQALAACHARGWETLPADRLCNEVCGEEPDDQTKFGVFVPAFNKVAAEYGFVRRRGTNSGDIMLGINPDGLVFHVVCLLLPVGKRFLDSLFPNNPDPH